MPKIKVKNPNYTETNGEEKWIDAAIYTGLANEGVEDAPNNGKDYVRRDSDWVISKKIYEELGITKDRFEALLNNVYNVPTLYNAPNENTLQYVDGEYTTDFKIGDYCRVRNTNNEYGYSFFRLYDIKDGLAVWSTEDISVDEIVSGETVLVSLISNQSSNDVSLIGATIQIYDVTADQVLKEEVWRGTELMLTVPTGHTYSIKVGDVNGYRTPKLKSYDSVDGAVRVITMQYDTTILSINFTSNYNANTASAVATVNYGNVVTTITSGQTVKIPYDVNVSVVCSKIPYYKTPIFETFTAGTSLKELNGQYLTSYLNVNYTKNQTVDGGTPVINIITEGTTRVYSPNIICAPGEQVTINFGTINYYKTPTDIVFTKAEGNENKTAEYLSEKVNVTLNTDNSKVVTGQVITLTCSSNSAYNGTYTCTSTATTGDSGYSFYIPYGYSYKVAANNFYSYAPSLSASYTAGTATRNITLQYTTKNINVYIKGVYPYGGSRFANYSFKVGSTEYNSDSWKTANVPCGTTLKIDITTNGNTPGSSSNYDGIAWIYAKGDKTSNLGSIVMNNREWKNLDTTIWEDTTIGIWGYVKPNTATVSGNELKVYDNNSSSYYSYYLLNDVSGVSALSSSWESIIRDSYSQVSYLDQCSNGFQDWSTYAAQSLCSYLQSRVGGNATPVAGIGSYQLNFLRSIGQYSASYIPYVALFDWDTTNWEDGDTVYFGMINQKVNTISNIDGSTLYTVGYSSYCEMGHAEYSYETDMYNLRYVVIDTMPKYNQNKMVYYYP